MPRPRGGASSGNRSTARDGHWDGVAIPQPRGSSITAASARSLGIASVATRSSIARVRCLSDDHPGRMIPNRRGAGTTTSWAFRHDRSLDTDRFPALDYRR
jgi:hypothetical protein